MATPDFAALVEVLQRFAEAEGAPDVDNRLERFVHELLLSKRELWMAYEERLITADDLVNSLLDRFLRRTLGLPNSTWPSRRTQEGWTAALRAEVLHNPK